MVGLAALSKVPVNVADRLMAGEQPDPVLILCKAAGMSWPTVKAIIAARPGGQTASSQSADSAFANYGRLSASDGAAGRALLAGSPDCLSTQSLQSFRKIRKQDARSSRAALA